jgi:lipopolysaccharide transport system ATP-binding protein
MNSDIAIKVENITKTYRLYDNHADRVKEAFHPLRKKYHHNFNALSNVNFEVGKGETLGIIGRNGSGKSTLLQIICGILQPSSGSVEVNGRISALLELGAGFNPEFTGRENVYVNGSILGLTHEELKNRFDEITAFADIGSFLDQPVKTYSTGMIVRLAFAVAINVDPQILVVDEVLAVGDELFQRKCFSRIEAIKKSGATILFVSHVGGLIVELCDRAILVDMGEMLAMGTSKNIVGHYQKLLYAPEEKQKEIRRSIQTSSSGVSSKESICKPLVENTPTSSRKSRSDDDQVEYFDPTLKPPTTLFYESLGASISLPEIFTLTGKRVNCLRCGETYHNIYNVQFEKDSYDVRFGMVIKAINGTEIGGIGSASLGHGINRITAGTILKVRFTFHCHLLPGHYFINAGCSGEVNSQDVFLHRIVDAAAFRVLPISHLEIRAGYIDFATKESYCVMEYKK